MRFIPQSLWDKPHEFWNYSLDEIRDLIEVYKKHKEETVKKLWYIITL